MRVRSILWGGLLGAGLAHAGGTWVGNSPMAVAFTAFTDYPLSADAGEPSAEEPAAEPYNSLLMRKGESRLALGFGQHYFYSAAGGFTRNETGKLSFDYGLSPRLTLMNLTTLAYGLKAGDGRGHELAALAGLTDGFSYTNNNLVAQSEVNGVGVEARGHLRRAEIGPGVALLHSWTDDRWRWVNSLSASSTLAWQKETYATNAAPDLFKDSSSGGWRDLTLRLRTALFRKLDERWALGFSAESYFAKFKAGSGLNADRSRWLIANPAASLSRKLGANAQFDYTIGSDGTKRPHLASSGDAVRVSHYLTVSARW